MDNQINKSMLEHLAIANGENDQEISKIASISALRGIENGSLHFITVPRDQEFIDHSLLNPEYITQFPNGFIVDFIPNGDGESSTQHIITDAASADLAFQAAPGINNGDVEQDRRLTAALLQLVNNKPCHIRIGNETQVIVANKELASSGDSRSVISHNNFSSTNHNQHVVQHETIADGHFKVYSHEKSITNQPQSESNPPLPPLTPIRRLARHRKNSVVNASSDIQIFQVNELNVSADDEIENRQRPLTKKSLPHKKRISKKLKNIEHIDAPPPIRQTVIYQDIKSSNPIQEVVEAPQFLQSIQSQFACELCDTVCSSQLEFFAHLKRHYEPESVVVMTTQIPVTPALQPKVMIKKSISDERNIILQHDGDEENFQFNNFTDSSISEMKIETQNEDPIKGQVQVVHDTTRDSVTPVQDDLQIDDVEFSDTEDMLEGIRGVVDKVQEAVENESNDEPDWYSSSSLNENVVYKTEEDNHNINNTVGNFSMFFKNNLDKNDEHQEIMLQQEENVIDHPTTIKSEESVTFASDPNTMPTESELEGMLVEDSACDGKMIKPAPKRFTRLRKPKSKSKLADEDFSEGNSFDGEVSSDDDGKYKKQRRKCPQCDKVFNSSNAYKYHELSHTGERPHQCDVCGKSFFAQSALKVHMRLHSGAKPYECEICKRAFRQWGDLKYHTISIHTNERNFQCEFCGKAFARRYSLVIHRRIHTSERNYKCEFCPKTFRASSYLQNHRKVHTGEKPYACPICGKKFRVSGDLKRHTNIHGREKKKRENEVASNIGNASKTESSKKLVVKPSVTNSEQIIQFMPKPSTSDIAIIKTEPNILMDLNLLQDDLHTIPTHSSLGKSESSARNSTVTNNSNMIYSDGAVEIFSTTTPDHY